jgi:hypothetical protein
MTIRIALVDDHWEGGGWMRIDYVTTATPTVAKIVTMGRDRGAEW